MNPTALRAQTWSLDSSFAPRIGYDYPTILYASFVALPNGQFFAHGDFTHVNGSAVPNLARLNADGSTDSTFVFEIGPDERLVEVAPLIDGRSIVLVGARYPTNVVSPLPSQPNPSGLPINVEPGLFTFPEAFKVIRLLSNGRVDSSFSTLTVAGGYRDPSLTPLPDGRVIIWGEFDSVGGVSRKSLARFDIDGTLDRNFAPAVFPTSEEIAAVAPRANGSLVVLVYGPTIRLARLLDNGAVDSTFADPFIQNHYFDPVLAVQTDGRVLTTAPGPRGLVRYSATGALDSTFAAGTPPGYGIGKVTPLPLGRLAVEAPGIGSTAAHGVFVLAANGQLERDLQQGTGAREDQRLLAVLSDGRLLRRQGTPIVDSSSSPTLAPQLWPSPRSPSARQTRQR